MDNSDNSDDLKDEHTKISPPPSLQRKRNIRDDILNLLRNARYGLNIKQISTALKLSRNTVKSYLSRFEKKNIIKVKEIGRAKICLLNEPPENYQSNPLELLLPAFFKNFLTAFHSAASQSLSNPRALMRKIGKEMAPLTFWPTVRLVPVSMNLKDPVSLDHLKLFALQFINILNSFGPLVNVTPLENSISKEHSAIILKVEDARHTGFNEYFYYLWAGILETKLREAFGETVYLSIREFDNENSTYYFELGIRPKL